MSWQLHIVKQDVAVHMDRIMKHFKPGTKITVMVRTPGLPEADFMMTDDDPREAMKLIERRIAAASTPHPTSDPVGFTDEQVKS